MDASSLTRHDAMWYKPFVLTRCISYLVLVFFLLLLACGPSGSKTKAQQTLSNILKLAQGIERCKGSADAAEKYAGTWRLTAKSNLQIQAAPSKWKDEFRNEGLDEIQGGTGLMTCKPSESTKFSCVTTENENVFVGCVEANGRFQMKSAESEKDVTTFEGSFADAGVKNILQFGAYQEDKKNEFVVLAVEVAIQRVPQ